MLKVHTNVKKTPEQFEYEVSKINDTIKIVGKYVNVKTKVKCECNVCGHIWETMPSSLLRNHGCPNCYRIRRANNDRKPFNLFLEELKGISPNIQIESCEDYKNTDSRVNCFCSECGYKWETTPHKLLSGCGCPKCKGVKKKTKDEFVDELKLLNNNITVIGEYTNNYTKIELECKVCSLRWFATPHSILGKNSGCPTCSESKGEKRIEQYLIENNIRYERQKEYENLVGINSGNLRFDFYLPDYELLIEYQGQFHDGTVSYQTKEQYDIQVEHDNRKYEFAKHNHIELLEIWYKDFNNIEQILKNRLTKVE